MSRFSKILQGMLIYGASEGGHAPEQMDDHMQEWYAYTESLQQAGVRIDDHHLHGLESATRDGVPANPAA